MSKDEELSHLVQKAGRGASSSQGDKRELLQFLRKENVRRPDLVMQHAPVLLKAGGLGDERWSVLEQAFIAAIDTGDLDAADGWLQPLEARFPESGRVRKLQGMRCEARGDYADADAIYLAVLGENPVNAAVAKRRVAVLTAQGKIPAAIEALNQYLGDFAGDVDAWVELASLHFRSSDYARAAFCYEELVIMSPANSFYHCRLAEIYFTQGGAERLMQARKHFCQSLELSKGYPRALHGLSLTCASMGSEPACVKALRAEGAEVNEALHAYATSELAQLYEQSPPELAVASAAVLAQRSKLVGEGAALAK
jgi:tetratricopeptide (TPR) repeat protein